MYCEKVCGSSRNFTRIVDSIATNGTADTASDLVCDGIVLLFWFRVVVSDVWEAVLRAVGASNGGHGSGIYKSGDLITVHAAPFGRSGAFVRASIGKRGSIRVEV